MISPLAVVEPGAQLGQNVEIYPFVYIQKDVVVGDNCVIYPRATLLNGTRMGSNNRVFQNAVIGAMPQSVHFKEGTPLHVTIGDNKLIRENVVIAGGYLDEKGTSIGNDNRLMDRIHISHDVHVKNRCVLGIGSILCSRSEVDSNTIISNSAVLQVDVRVGRYSLIESGCRVQKDVPPYIMLGGNPACYHGVNQTVLERTGTDSRTVRHIGNAYRLVYMGDFSIEDAVLQIKDQIPKSSEIDYITNFIESAKHGIIRRLPKED